MARALKHPERLLPNGILLKSHEFDPETDGGVFNAAKNKFRHWTAEKDSVLYGEFRSWQKSLYHVSEKEYGRNGGTYSSVMVKRTWLPTSYGSIQFSSKMSFWTWVREIKQIDPDLMEPVAYQDDAVKPRDDAVTVSSPQEFFAEVLKNDPRQEELSAKALNLWEEAEKLHGVPYKWRGPTEGCDGFDPLEFPEKFAPVAKEDAEAFGPIAAESWPEDE